MGHGEAECEHFNGAVVRYHLGDLHQVLRIEMLMFIQGWLCVESDSSRLNYVQFIILLATRHMQLQKNVEKIEKYVEKVFDLQGRVTAGLQQKVLISL